jgi:hypothetical protein
MTSAARKEFGLREETIYAKTTAIAGSTFESLKSGASFVLREVGESLKRAGKRLAEFRMTQASIVLTTSRHLLYHHAEFSSLESNPSRFQITSVAYHHIQQSDTIFFAYHVISVACQRPFTVVTEYFVHE